MQLSGLQLGEDISYRDAAKFIFKRAPLELSFSTNAQKRIVTSEKYVYELMEKKVPIYGVTTGFGDSSFRFIPTSKSEELQKNLVNYLLCGSGRRLSRETTRATSLFRLQSLARGYSGVSLELLDRLKIYCQNDWLPIIPCQGSLGASGDLIPLAYIAQILQGEGIVETSEGVKPAFQLLSEYNLKPYRLKPKEGLALVNGTSVMAGLSFINLTDSRFIIEMAEMCTVWAVLALKGKNDSFSPLVNAKAKRHSGQSTVAANILRGLKEEAFEGSKLENGAHVQDRYSIRCTPQILGPVVDTMDFSEKWIMTEANGVSDNPLIGEDGELAMGGNFYGGYLSHAMDYLKISLANVADLVDRQLMTLIDEKSNRGLTPNLANWNGMSEEERFLHHGLKGLHQSVSAITSEILAKATPNSIFSRSSESHNQDKVSLGMSAAVSCEDMIESLYSVMTLYLVCLAQALDLRGIELKGADSKGLYEKVRQAVPFVDRDSALGEKIEALKNSLKDSCRRRGSFA